MSKLHLLPPGVGATDEVVHGVQHLKRDILLTHRHPGLRESDALPKRECPLRKPSAIDLQNPEWQRLQRGDVIHPIPGDYRRVAVVDRRRAHDRYPSHGRATAVVRASMS